MSDMSALETRMGFEDQKTIISELQSRLDAAEIKIVDGEKLRKKLHNTILVKLFICFFFHYFTFLMGKYIMTKVCYLQDRN